VVEANAPGFAEEALAALLAAEEIEEHVAAD